MVGYQLAKPNANGHRVRLDNTILCYQAVMNEARSSGNLLPSSSQRIMMEIINISEIVGNDLSTFFLKNQDIKQTYFASN